MASSTVSYKKADTGDLAGYLAGKVKSAAGMAAEERKSRDEEVKALEKEISHLESKELLSDDQRQRLDDAKSRFNFLTEQQSGRKGSFFGKALASEFGGDRFRRMKGTFSKDPAAENDPALSKGERFTALLNKAEEPVKPESPYTQLSLPGMESEGGNGLQTFLDRTFKTVAASYDRIADKVSALGAAEKESVQQDANNNKFLNSISSGLKSFKEYFSKDNKLKQQENNIEIEQLELNIEQKEEADMASAEARLEAEKDTSTVKQVRTPYGGGGEDPMGGGIFDRLSGFMNFLSDMGGGMLDYVDEKRSTRRKPPRKSPATPRKTPQKKPRFRLPFRRKFAEGGVYDNPTNVGLNPGDSVIPLNRNNALSKVFKGAGSKADTSMVTPMSQVMQLPAQVGGGLLLGLLSQTINKLGGVSTILKPIIGKIAQPLALAFGLPATIVGSMFGGSAQAATFDPSSYLSGAATGGGGGRGRGRGAGANPPGAGPVTPTGTISAAPTGNETGLQSLSGGTPTTIAAGSTVSNTQLHHGKEDMRRGFRVRDYFIGGKSGPSDGSDGLGAKLYTPLGFGPVKYKKLDAHGITFHDPQTDQKVGMYYHVNDPQHHLDGQVLQPGTLVGTQGGLPGTPSANPGSSSVHLHVEGTDQFHNAVIATYAGGNVLKAPGVHSQVAAANPAATGTRNGLGLTAQPTAGTPQMPPPAANGQQALANIIAMNTQREAQQKQGLGLTNQFPVSNALTTPNYYGGTGW
jgi:hypothetical protein